MAQLDTTARDECHRSFEDEVFNQARVATGLSRADLRAAVNALDDYLNTNAAAINLAIPSPARTSLTVAQKALLLVYVIRQRYIKGV